MPHDLPHIPYDVFRAHILPHLDIDARIAFQSPPGRIDPAQFSRIEHSLKRRLRATWYSPAAGLTWMKLRVPCTGKVFVHRVHGATGCERCVQVGCDLVDYRSRRRPMTTTLWDV